MRKTRIMLGGLIFDNWKIKRKIDELERSIKFLNMRLDQLDKEAADYSSDSTAKSAHG